LDKPLFDILNEEEIKAVKLGTDIRNCKIKDLTVQELDDLWLYLPHTTTLKYAGLNTAAQVLQGLADRIFNRQIPPIETVSPTY